MLVTATASGATQLYAACSPSPSERELDGKAYFIPAGISILCGDVPRYGGIPSTKNWS